MTQGQWIDIRGLSEPVAQNVASRVAVALTILSSFQCAHAEETDCVDQDITLRAAPDDPVPYRIHARLCGASPDHPGVQVLLHGSTYDGRYWDPPGLPEQYSYVRGTADAGYASLIIDRLGSGESDHPASSAVTLDVHARALHEVVGQLRRGEIGGHPYSKVVTVGHSLGSVIAVLEAGFHNDVDGVIASGFTHQWNEAAFAALGAALYPAALEPQFAALDPGYLTTRPGARRDLFFAGTFDERAVQYDEPAKGIITAGELESSPADPSASVLAPVLIVDGDVDPFVCGTAGCSSSTTLEEQERAAFSSSRDVRVILIPSTGHALNLHDSASLWFEAAYQWLSSLSFEGRDGED